MQPQTPIKRGNNNNRATATPPRTPQFKRTVARPRLPRSVAASARINLNKFWDSLEEVYVKREESFKCIMACNSCDNSSSSSSSNNNSYLNKVKGNVNVVYNDSYLDYRASIDSILRSSLNNNSLDNSFCNDSFNNNSSSSSNSFSEDEDDSMWDSMSEEFGLNF